MNFQKNSSDIDYNFQLKISSSKNSITQDLLKNIPSNQITINFSKDSNSSEKNKNKKNLKQKTYISKYQNEEKGFEAEEDEINSDEYVSSTNLDVETDTYINLANNIRTTEEKVFNSINKQKNNNIISEGKLRIKENKKNNENNINMFLLDNIKSFIDEKESSTNTNANNKNININKINLNKVKIDDNNNKHNKNNIYHQSNKSDYFLVNRTGSINKDKKNDSKNSNSIDNKGIFTPNNDSKKRFKVLRDMIIKKIKHYDNKNPFNINQSNTINIIDNNNDNKATKENKIKSINNDIVKKNIKLDLDISNKNKRHNKISQIMHNNSITIISNNCNKNIPDKITNQQNVQNNNNININIYNKNIIKDLGVLNIDSQKFHFIPQSTKKAKTQGRVGKIVYNNQNKRNNFIYISNYPNNNNNKNKTANSPQNKKNRISPSPNYMNNIENYNSICINKNNQFEENNILKHNNIHSLKNLKSEKFQKNIKKYILEDEYLTIFPLSNEKNISEKQKIKSLKNSKNKKFVKNKNNNKFTEDIKQNLNDIKIKKIIPSNINSNTKQLRSVNSCYAKKINQHFLNNYQTEQILNTISNNHNKKINIYNNFKSDCGDYTQNKNINNSNKRVIDEKMRNRELSFNIAQDNYSINKLLSLKKIKNLKNKLMLQSSDYYFENNREINNHHLKKNKIITTRVKLDLMTEGNKKNCIKNNSKISLSNNNNINKNERNMTKINDNSSAKRIIYIDNNDFKKFNSRPLIYNSLSPNCQSIKQLMNKTKISNIKEIYSNIKHNNQGRNTYNIYVSSKLNNNSNNLKRNGSSANSTNKIFIKKIKKTSINNNLTNNATKTINYNSDNIYEFPSSNLSSQNKKIIVFNNVSNYNINSTNNTLNNITSIKEGQNNNIYKKTIEIFSPFSSINNKNNNNHKKIYYNKQNTHINNGITSKDKKNDVGLEENIIYLDNNKIKNVHTYTGSNSSNKNLYNKNMIYKLNKNGNFDHNNHNMNYSQNNYNIRINNNQNNNILLFSNSNDKERNSNSNKSYGNLYIHKNKKEKSKAKSGILEFLEKDQK